MSSPRAASTKSDQANNHHNDNLKSSSPASRLDDIDKIAKDLLAEIDRELGDDDDDKECDDAKSEDLETTAALPRNIYFETPAAKKTPSPLSDRNLLAELEKRSPDVEPEELPPDLELEKLSPGSNPTGVVVDKPKGAVVDAVADASFHQEPKQNPNLLEELDDTFHREPKQNPNLSEDVVDATFQLEPKQKPNLLEELDKVAALGPPVTNPPWMQEGGGWMMEEGDPLQEPDKASVNEPAPPPSPPKPSPLDSDWLFQEDDGKASALPNGGSGTRHATVPETRHVEQEASKSPEIKETIFVLSLSLEILQYLVTNRPSFLLRMANLFLALNLYVDVVFSTKMHRNPLALAMNRLAAWNVAYVSLSLSFFTTPGDQWLSGEMHIVNLIGTCFFPIAVLDSLSVLRSEIRARSIFLQGFVVENVVVYSHLLGLPLLRILLGFDTVAQLYVDHQVAESIYLVSLLSAITISVEFYHVSRVSSGTLEPSNYSTVSSLLWGWFHLPGCAFLVGCLNTFLLGTRFYARSLLVFFIGRVVTKLLEGSNWLQYKPLGDRRMKRN